jgi:hypothetical protein
VQRPLGHRDEATCVGDLVTDDTTTTSPEPDRRDLGRYIAAGIVIAAFIALAALAIAASRSSFSIGLPAGASEPDHTAPEALPSVPALTSFATPAPAPAPVVPLPPVEAPADPVAPAPTPTTLAPPPPLEAAPAGVPCPQLGLLAPDEVGGLQSLISLVPLFGPFSPEAFALMPAFQPGFEALGPLFPVFEKGLDAAAPLLGVVTPVVQQLGQAGFGFLAPLYGPVRGDVLTAEKQLAAQLEPVIRQLATAPGSECLVALEGVLASLVN